MMNKKLVCSFLFVFCVSSLMPNVSEAGPKKRRRATKRVLSASERNKAEVQRLLRVENLNPDSQGHARLIELLRDPDTNKETALKAAQFGSTQARQTDVVDTAKKALDFMEAVDHAKYDMADVRDYTAKSMLDFLLSCVAATRSEGTPLTCRSGDNPAQLEPSSEYVLELLTGAQKRASDDVSSDIISAIIELAESADKYDPYLSWLSKNGFYSHAERIRNERLRGAR